MGSSAELQRFLADHATPEGAARFLSAVGPAPRDAAIAAGAGNLGYRLTETEAGKAGDALKQIAAELSADELDRVAGGVPQRRHPAYYSY